MCFPCGHGCSLVGCWPAKKVLQSRAMAIPAAKFISDFFILVRTVPTVSLLAKSTDVTIERMEPSGKRTIQVNVKMSAEDFTTLQKAANALWPDSILSNSGIILGLARLAAKDILKKKPAKRRR